MDELQKGLIAVLLAGATAVSEKASVAAARQLYSRLKALLKRDHGVSAVDKLDSKEPPATVQAELAAQLQKVPAAAASPEVQALMLQLLDAAPTLVDVEGVAAYRKLLIRNVAGRVSVRNSSVGDDLVIENIGGGSPPGK